MLVSFPQGSVYSWGCADCVGDGSGVNRFAPKELRLIDSLPRRGVVSPVCRRIAARFSQSMAVMVGGHLLVWGQSFNARFFCAPRQTFVFSNSHKVVQIAIGKSFALALTGVLGRMHGSKWYSMLRFSCSCAATGDPILAMGVLCAFRLQSKGRCSDGATARTASSVRCLDGQASCSAHQ